MVAEAPSMFAVLLTMAVAAVQAEAGVDREELKRLQGTWAVMSQEHGGKKSDAKSIANLTVEVAGTKVTTRDGVDVKEDASLTRLGARAKPGEVDLKITAGVDLDKVVKGIWKLEGDTLTICIAEPDKERPKAFEAKEGSGHTLLVLKKAKK